ncbi:MAG: peptidylprolyl isomerase [Endozoicomonas sp.]
MPRLYKSLITLFFALTLTSVQASNEKIAGDPVKEQPGLKVKLSTSKGDIILKLDKDKAPLTVENFLHYVESGFYQNLVFHRVIPGFMVQTGGMTADMSQKNTTRRPVQNESANGLSNRRGTIAMARTTDPNSATSQFFINTVNNTNLNYRAGRSGYAVFGEVAEGMDVVDRISGEKTGRRGRYSDVPVEPIQILKVERVSPRAVVGKKAGF